MVWIISGRTNSGKTEKIESIFNEKGGDGIVSKKIFKNTTFIGYEIQRLSTKKRLPLAWIKGYETLQCDEIFTFRRFSFSSKAFLFAQDVCDDILKKDISPIYIDEIGPIELNNRGFAPFLKKALESKRELYITVRKWLVSEIIEIFAIQDYQIIDLSKGAIT